MACEWLLETYSGIEARPEAWAGIQLLHGREQSARESIQGAVTFPDRGDRGIPQGTLGRKNNLVAWASRLSRLRSRCTRSSSLEKPGEVLLA